MDDPATDCESLRLEGDRIIDIGKTPVPLDEVEGQYIGMVRFAAGVLDETLDWFERQVTREPSYWDVSMTELLMDRIESGEPVTAVPIWSGWLEVDTAQDLERYRRAHHEGVLSSFWAPALRADRVDRP